MRQIKSCKVGHFVKYNDVLCQVNCFYTSMGEKHATLIQVAEPEESKRLFTPLASEKVEYLGMSARGKNGEIWVGTKRALLSQFLSTESNV